MHFSSGRLCLPFLVASLVAVQGCGSSSNESPQSMDDDAGSGTVLDGAGTDANVAGDAANPVPAEGGTASPDAAGSFTEASHQAFPSVINWGGSVLTAPKVVTITFGSDTLATQFDTFGQSAASSSWWDAVRAGDCDANGTTCVGDGPTGTSVAVPAAAAASYTDSLEGAASSLQTALSNLITAHTVPAPDANTIYVMYLPGTTKITMDPQDPAVNSPYDCPDTYGYHNGMKVGQTQVWYSVVLECPPDPSAPSQAPPTTVLGNATGTAAHEIVETATDPDSNEFYLDTSDPNTWGWNDVLGGELGDMCVDPFALGQDGTMDGAFLAQRIWSVPAAKAGHNPCVPVPVGEIYFNAAPATSSVVVVDVGQSKTIEVDAFSDAARADWTLTAADWTDLNTTYLSFSIAGASAPDAGVDLQVNNGSKIQLTVTLLADPGQTTNGEADAVLISANGDPSTMTEAHLWPFIVMTPAEATDAGIAAQKHQHHTVSGFARFAPRARIVSRSSSRRSSETGLGM